MKFLLFVYTLILHSSIQALPSDSQKKDFKIQCVKAKVMKNLIDQKSTSCPHSILKIKKGEKNLDPIVCILSNKNHTLMTKPCFKAAENIYNEIPSFFQPAIEGY